MGAPTTTDRSDRSAYFYEKMYVVYEDNRGKLRFTIKHKLNIMTLTELHHYFISIHIYKITHGLLPTVFFEGIHIQQKCKESV